MSFGRFRAKRGKCNDSFILSYRNATSREPHLVNQTAYKSVTGKYKPLESDYPFSFLEYMMMSPTKSFTSNFMFRDVGFFKNFMSIGPGMWNF